MIKYNKANKTLTFNKIKFFNWSYEKIINKILKESGYLVAPAASSLIKIKNNKFYHLSLKKSNIAIFDSGFLCLLLRLNFIFVKKFSGYLFLYKFLNDERIKEKKILLINPNNKDGKKNRRLLKKKGFKKLITYTAPFYKSQYNDEKLVNIIKKNKPNFVINNLGGEVQEPLAYYLTQEKKLKTFIICTGAAIAFMTKAQAPINLIIDRMYLGWFVRLIFNPKAYFLRIIQSLGLVFLLKS